MNKGYKAIKGVLAKDGTTIAAERNKILVSPHINPDGDAIGSTIGFAHMAKALGFDVRIYLPDGIPKILGWIENPFGHVPKLDDLGDWTPDIIITLDCGDAKRPGPELADVLLNAKGKEGKWQELLTINIDHHTGNPEFADLNWVEQNWSSTGQMVGFLAEDLGLELKGPLGEAIYLTLVSDTGGFSFSNTTGTVHKMAARILDHGLQIGKFTSNHENNWSENRLHAWGELMQNISLHADGKIASIIVHKIFMQKNQLQKGDLEGFASMLRKIKGVKVAVYIREDAENFCKISLRSMGDVNVNPVAKSFGGGGHTSAAGAEMHMSPEAAREAVLEQLTPLVQN